MTVETTTTGASAIDRSRIAALTEREMAKLAERTPASKERYERAVKVMPKGVPSSFQENDPWPVYVERGAGTSVWDVDGNEYIDFHNGFGVMCIGHANPTVGAAVKARVDLGTHFAAPTDGSIVVAEELTRRFGLPQWRFTNSGTESTMAAVHLARGATGRDVMLKIEGSYHGHHDAVMVSVYPSLEEIGDRDNPHSVPYGDGYPGALSELTHVVPFNDAKALESALTRLEGQRGGADHGAGDDEHQRHPPRRRLSGAGSRAHRRARREADLRRGEDGRHDLLRRRHAALRGHPRHGDPGQGDLRRLPRRRDRDDRGDRRAGGHRQGPSVRHLQRQPAGDGRIGGHPDRGAHRGRLLEARGHQREAEGGLPGDHRPLRPPRLHGGNGRQGLRGLRARAAARVPRLPDQGRRRARQPSPGSTT